MDVIKVADYVIDLGPEGGDEGGRIIATGTPEEVAESPGSYTGLYLRQVLRPEKGYRPFTVNPSQVSDEQIPPLQAKDSAPPGTRGNRGKRRRNAAGQKRSAVG